MRGSKGGGAGGSDPPPDLPSEKSQKYRVSKQCWSGSPEKITKLTSKHSKLGRRWPARKTPFLLALFGSSLPSSTYLTLTQ